MTKTSAVHSPRRPQRVPAPEVPQVPIAATTLSTRRLSSKPGSSRTSERAPRRREHLRFSTAGVMVQKMIIPKQMKENPCKWRKPMLCEWVLDHPKWVNHCKHPTGTQSPSDGTGAQDCRTFQNDQWHSAKIARKTQTCTDDQPHTDAQCTHLSHGSLRFGDSYLGPASSFGEVKPVTKGHKHPHAPRGEKSIYIRLVGSWFHHVPSKILRSHHGRRLWGNLAQGKLMKIDIKNDRFERNIFFATIIHSIKPKSYEYLLCHGTKHAAKHVACTSSAWAFGILAAMVRNSAWMIGIISLQWPKKRWSPQNAALVPVFVPLQRAKFRFHRLILVGHKNDSC